VLYLQHEAPPPQLRYRDVYLGTDRGNTENKKYRFDGLQVVKESLQTTAV